MNEFRFNGRIKEKPELIESEKGNKYCYVFIEVKRNYQDGEGNELYDNFKLTCFKAVAQEAAERLDKDVSVIVKGRIQENIYKQEDKEIAYRPELILEKIEYL